MKKTSTIFFAFIFLNVFVNAQIKSVSPGNNRKASVSERIGITDVTVNYDRPGVKGREGKIYGTSIVHNGFQETSFATGKPFPWRAGANDNTIIEFSTDVKVEGKDLPAGKYGFFIAYGQTESIIIFSKNTTSWGAFYYDDKEDALRATVKTVALDKSVEWLKYEFINQTGNSATIAMQWEKVMIPFKVEVDLVKTQLAEYRSKLRGQEGFRWENLVAAAELCSENTTTLDEGLSFANNAVRFNRNFQTLSTKAVILEKLGKKTQADSTMQMAMSVGQVMEIHLYGRQLLNQKKNKEALEIFKANAKKNPNQFTTYVGLTRGYSANGDYKTALVNAKLALPLAPDPQNKGAVEGMIKKLETGVDVN